MFIGVLTASPRIKVHVLGGMMAHLAALQSDSISIPDPELRLLSVCVSKCVRVNVKNTNIQSIKKHLYPHLSN